MKTMLLGAAVAAAVFAPAMASAAVESFQFTSADITPPSRWTWSEVRR